MVGMCALRKKWAALPHPAPRKLAKFNPFKFRRQLKSLVAQQDYDNLLIRIDKGSEYYRNFLFGELEKLLKHLEFVKSLSKTVTYQKCGEGCGTM